MQQLRNRIEQTQVKIDALEEEQGSNVESENELQRLKQLKKILKPILKTKKKELVALQKIPKAKDKEQAKVDKLRASISAKEREKKSCRSKAQQHKTA